MKAILIAAALVLTGGATAAYAQQDNWGQEVKSCNETNCYPGGTSRGEFVRGEAKDSEGPGYANEIHDRANPGKADPNGKKFQ